jgi:para-aminobenzoate synthetase/4-amino-4-deoxychorismate lyase
VAAHRRPDPAKGVFETLLVLDGRPVEWDAHLARLNASLAVLYPDRTPPDLDVPAIDRPWGGSTTRASAEALRITVAPSASGRLAATVASRPASGEFGSLSGTNPPDAGVSLRSLTVPGGLGPHKWADRSLLDEAQAAMPDGALPLIVDDDEVLEVSRANLFAVRDGALFTPPLDGRILPGVTRMRVVEIAAEMRVTTHEKSISRDELLTADEVFLTGSVRGIEHVDSLDSVRLRGGMHMGLTLWSAWTDAIHEGLRRVPTGISARPGRSMTKRDGHGTVPA